MGFEYSSFFSYRRNQGNIDFINNLKNIIQSEGHFATNSQNIFFDSKSIDTGEEFDTRIYESIIKSYSFTLIFSPHYINKENDWCARELYRAIKFEEYIREKINNKSFCLIFPLMYRGETSDLPKGIEKKNALILYEYLSEITNASLSNYPVSQKFEGFKKLIGDFLLKNFKLIEDVEFDWDEINQKVEIPSEGELSQWIEVQKGILKSNESKNPPILI